MRYIVFILVFIITISANDIFQKNKEYKCIHTFSMQKGKKILSSAADKKHPFIFKIEGNKIITPNQMTFDFQMKENQMSSYSNELYMLLLTKNLELGLVPKEAKGQIQFYFQCKER